MSEIARGGYICGHCDKMIAHSGLPVQLLDGKLACTPCIRRRTEALKIANDIQRAFNGSPFTQGDRVQIISQNEHTGEVGTVHKCSCFRTKDRDRHDTWLVDVRIDGKTYEMAFTADELKLIPT